MHQINENLVILDTKDKTDISDLANTFVEVKKIKISDYGKV